MAPKITRISKNFFKLGDENNISMATLVDKYLHIMCIILRKKIFVLISDSKRINLYLVFFVLCK